MTTRPPQWLFDEIRQLPSEVRGWALGFMCAGYLAGVEDSRTQPYALKQVMDLVPLDPPHPDCGGKLAKQKPSTMFGSPDGYAISCASCGEFIMYIGTATDRVTITDWQTFQNPPSAKNSPQGSDGV